MTDSACSRNFLATAIRGTFLCFPFAMIVLYISAEAGFLSYVTGTSFLAIASERYEPSKKLRFADGLILKEMDSQPRCL